MIYDVRCQNVLCMPTGRQRLLFRVESGESLAGVVRIVCPRCDRLNIIVLDKLEKTQYTALVTE